VGVTELQLAEECEVLFKKYGSNQLAFPPVIAFGSHTALPHHQPTNTALKKEMAVLLDIGGRVDGYCGDMTRTWWFGDVVPEEFTKLEKIVLEAYAAGLAAVHVGCGSDEIDQQARNVIDKAGYGKYFIHTTGHGVGLEIHEQPSVYFKKKVLLPEHAVFTIEPGIYLDGKFGYRYENTILIEATGAKELTL
jgi:Xaa-Pro dipeptidase